MSQQTPIPAPPGEPAWEIVFTRLMQAVQPLVLTCALDLERQFRAIGLDCETTVRQTPRGVSTFLALVGQRGLICFVDLTLVDGRVVGQGSSAALDMRLLDADGDLVAGGPVSDAKGRAFREPSVAQAFIAENMARAATAVYVATLGHFDVLRPVARHA